MQALTDEVMLENLTGVLANLYLKHLPLAWNIIFKSRMSLLITFMNGKKQLGGDSLLGMGETQGLIQTLQTNKQTCLFS